MATYWQPATAKATATIRSAIAEPIRISVQMYLIGPTGTLWPAVTPVDLVVSLTSSAWAAFKFDFGVDVKPGTYTAYVDVYERETGTSQVVLAAVGTELVTLKSMAGAFTVEIVWE